MTMDIIKTEPEEDLLFAHTSDHSNIEETDPLSQEENFGTSVMNTEGIDTSYYPSSKVKLEENSLVKFEPVEDSYDVFTVKREQNLEVKIEENDVYAQSLEDPVTQMLKYHRDTEDNKVQFPDCADEFVIPRTPNCERNFGSKDVDILCTDDQNAESKYVSVKNNLCHICEKVFRDEKSLRRHIRTHNGEKLFKCDICSKFYVSSSNLRVHLRQHTGEKPFKCDFCDTCFTQASNLTVHLRHHTGEKPFKCNICNKNFSHLQSLKRHEIQHSNLKPYKCDHCQKSVTQSATFISHLRSHTGEKPFKCDVCSKSFSHVRSFKRHEIVHTDRDFKCKECDRIFSKRIFLNVHVRRCHSDRKLFNCHDCGRNLSSSRTFKLHIRRHADDKDA